ncbi:MAG: sigma-54-dependent Fis family transcriptional regulator, partial [Planctomycetes bacterium]|nr:sigma-54-dependent Fis family transcriptional regulator [Planctomycetota bacterium]
MLVRLLIAISDPRLAERLANAPTSANLLAERADRTASLADYRDRFDPDLILIDSTWVGGPAQLRRLLPNLRRADKSRAQPEIVYLATHESPDDRAALIAAGCTTVVDAAAGDGTVEAALNSLVDRHRDQAEQLRDTTNPLEQFELGDFVSHSPTMARFMKIAHRVAKSTSSVLILGETGVGKEKLANAIHLAGDRRERPFTVVNCGAIPESLMESELFGHEKGSFTGAHRAHRGFFEMGHGGTVFLDEIGEMPPHLQVKLLRVLQERHVQRVGSEAPIDVDVRLIAATNRDLKSEMDAGRFRTDLFYRLSVVTLTIPPLRERREDIPLLVDGYLRRYRTELRATAVRVSDLAMKALQ